MSKLNRVESILAPVRQVQMDRWRAAAGDLLPEMLRSQNDAMRQLRHNSPEVRKVAIEVLSYHWKSYGSKQFAEMCEELSTHDLSQRVRHAALLALGSCFEGTDDVRIGVLLAKIVADEVIQDTIRMAAYSGLLSVRNPTRKLQLGAAFSMKDIDWEFVAASLVQTRYAVPVDPWEEPTAHLPESLAAVFQLYRQGLEAGKRGESLKSIEAFTAALQLQPNAVAILVARGRALLDMGSVDAAIGDLTSAIDLNPGLAKAYRERGRAYRKKGLINLAEKDEGAADALSEEK